MYESGSHCRFRSGKDMDTRYEMILNPESMTIWRCLK